MRIKFPASPSTKGRPSLIRGSGFSASHQQLRPLSRDCLESPLEPRTHSPPQLPPPLQGSGCVFSTEQREATSLKFLQLPNPRPRASPHLRGAPATTWYDRGPALQEKEGTFTRAADTFTAITQSKEVEKSFQYPHSKTGRAMILHPAEDS